LHKVASQWFRNLYLLRMAANRLANSEPVQETMGQ